MIKRFLACALLCVSISAVPAFSQDTIDKTYKQNAASYTNYKDCIRLYKLPYEKLYYLALSSANFNKYEIKEMQSRNGYIITPCDNNYYFNPQIPRKIYNYVDLHFNSEVKELKF